jgi:hypothetical protein
MRALETDEIFVDFITGNHDAFVIEDADHLLMARSNGNVDLHRFLAVADGVVRAQGRKIIFTTNLPNIGDIDQALVRPGRCFATVRTRALERFEAAALLARLAAARRERNEPANAVKLAQTSENMTKTPRLKRTTLWTQSYSRCSFADCVRRFRRQKGLRFPRRLNRGALCLQFAKRPGRGIERSIDVEVRHGAAQEHVVPRVDIDAAFQHLAGPEEAESQIRILIE